MIIAVVGPTGVGKTKLSLKLASIYHGEIINCDSLQIYKDLDIGTAKVTKEEMGKIPHHLLSFKDVSEEYSAYDYQIDARKKIEEIKARGNIPIFVGGTGYYLKAALYDYQFKSKDENIEENINKDLKCLYDDVLFIGLSAPRDVLYKKINERFDKMVIPLIDEVKPFYLNNIKTKPLMYGIGYKEFYPFFENKKTLQEVVAECKKNSCNYAKRQYTWFNNQLPVKWFNVNFHNFDETIKEVVSFIEGEVNAQNK